MYIPIPISVYKIYFKYSTDIPIIINKNLYVSISTDSDRTWLTGS